MSHWSYRIIEDEHGGLAIHEVYFNSEGTIDSWSKDGMAPFGENLYDLSSDFRMMGDAFYENVLREVETEGKIGLEEHPVYTKRTEIK